MFDNKRYLTCRVDDLIPTEMQLFLWSCVDGLPEPRDHLQIFDLKRVGSMQSITHRSEEPEYQKDYIMPSNSPVIAKIYVIDDGTQSTMILAEEY